MTVPVECDKSTRCLNFRLATRPDCNGCGERVTGNHFHDNLAGYRICHGCFVLNRLEIHAGKYRPTSFIVGEVRTCENHAPCFREAPYGMFTPKLCDGCAEYPPQHYHDVTQNIRLCLSCYGRRFGELEA